MRMRVFFSKIISGNFNRVNSALEWCIGMVCLADSVNNDAKKKSEFPERAD